MARVKGAMMTRKRRNKVLGLAKGYCKQKKREFRQLWITRISAGAKANGMNYSTFMHGLKLAGIDMNRKMLSETAIHDPEVFTALCETAKKALN